MIDHDSAVKLVASFSVLPFFHTVTKEGLAVMVQTVERFVESESHGNAVQEELLFGDRVPSPAEIRTAALATKPQEQSFHYDAPNAEEIAENAKWAAEIAKQLSGVK